MNLGQSRIVLRHRSALEVMDLALRFVRSVRPGLMLRLVALFAVPAWLVMLGLRYAAGWHWGVVWPTALFLAWLLELPFTVTAGRLLFERELNLRQVLSQSGTVLWQHCISQLLVTLLLAVSSLIIVGPLFVGATYCFVTEAAALERASGVQALGRAKTFLKNRSGTGMETVFLRGTLLLTFILLGELFGQAIVSFVFDIHEPVEQLFEDGGSPFALLGLFLSIPYAAVYRFLSYANERTRQDGWDVQVAFLAIAAKRRGDAA